MYYNTNSTIKHPDVRSKGTHVNKFRVPLKTVTFESHTRKVLDENNFLMNNERRIKSSEDYLGQ